MSLLSPSSIYPIGKLTKDEGIPYGTLLHCLCESLTSYKDCIQAGPVVSRGFMIYSSGLENLLIMINPSQYRFELNKM